MKNTLVRKFQPPAGVAPADESVTGQTDAGATPQAGAPGASDVEIPEINTNFIDNLFTDPTFVDRFDVAFGQTVPMGLEAEGKPGAGGAAPQGEAKEWGDLLDISFTKPLQK
jgi:hypothetical protein